MLRVSYSRLSTTTASQGLNMSTDEYLVSPKMERGRLGGNLVSTSSTFKASN